MASTDVLNCIQQILGDVAKQEIPSIVYQELEDAVTRNCFKASAHIDHVDVVSQFLQTESEALRLAINGIGPTRTVELSSAGVTQQGGEASSSSGANRPAASQKSKVQAEYVRVASILGRIRSLLEPHGPALLLRDVKNFPNLIRDSLETISYLEDANQAVVDQINGTHDRLDDLVRRVT
ncbi:hypothetical protein PYCCODRAFT_1471868 [Trametes coccinea BRFM310]|uniref:Uncharacterized protein n=1 Tax=Trametes coccinea (strain BRFM310) TaxID=1353009 RepID=A0A1Y2I9S5_TRAC3|nr:hypothetical protein PYCCODRAFT_1471868 [Trametes coccinea BRFM310]